jgi:hypothetical protein
MANNQVEKNYCRHCGATENLQSHHISYEPEIIQTLCVKCHLAVHENKHGVGKSSSSLLYKKLIDEWIKLRKEKNMNRMRATMILGISYMTGYLWDKRLGIIPPPSIHQSSIKIKVTIEDDLIKMIDKEAQRLGLRSRSLLISPILRKHFKLPNMFEVEKK